ncbi:MAG: aminotransferase class III-fold pyridoxal phosphate-dependent enzyme [Phycisphaerae bacterium]|nr:aminotransferase class III-fold pyridoxal phosphate-dependent enzyme [Phycisphaerae bacterium]
MLTLHVPVSGRPPQEPTIGPAPWIVVSPPGPMTALALPHDRRAVASPNGWPYPLVVRRARGSVVEDLDGNRYLDFTAGALATVAGHAHPMVVRAVQEQVERMAKACSGEFTSEPLMALARKLAQLAPTRGDNRVLFANNRMQSLEAVLKMARRRTRRNRVITFDGNSHNRGLAAITLDLSRPRHRRRIPPAAWVVDSLPYGSVVAVHDYFQSGLGEEVAVIFAESMLTEEDYHVPSADFLPELRRVCDEHGILLVIDETRTGMGRTGRMFGCEHFGVQADVLLAATGLNSGMPIHALIAPETLLSSDEGLLSAPYIGNPVSCASALASVEALEKHLIANAARLAPIFISKLEQIDGRRRCLGSPRGMGLLLAVDVRKPRRSQTPAGQLRERIITESFRRGLLLWGCGDTTIRFCPPLCINQVQLEVGLNVFEEAVATVAT